MPAVAQRHRLDQLELGIVAHRLDVGGEHALDQIETTRPQIGQAHRAVDDRQVGDLVDEDVVLVPVVGELLDDDAVLLDALDELEGPGADRMQPELVARRFGRLGRHHHAGAVGELGEQRRERLLQDEPDRQGIDDLDLVDGAQLGLAERALHRQVAVEAVLRRRGVERLAVVELHARPELDGDGLAVGRGLVARAPAAARPPASRRCRTACRKSTRKRCGRHRCARETDRARRGPRPGRRADGSPPMHCLPAPRRAPGKGPSGRLFFS